MLDIPSNHNYVAAILGLQERHLAAAIDKAFGSFAEMQYIFSNAASAFSGSG